MVSTARPACPAGRVRQLGPLGPAGPGLPGSPRLTASAQSAAPSVGRAVVSAPAIQREPP